MTTRTWIGGSNNKASNPRDWIDSNNQSGVPLQNDTLQVLSSSLTMSVRGNDLAGDPLVIAPGAGNFTANLSKQAQMSVSQSDDLGQPPAPSTFNLSQESTLSLSLGGFGPGVGPGNLAVVNISGSDTAYISERFLSGFWAPVAVNLEDGAKWTGGFDILESPGITVTGGANTAFNNTGSFIGLFDGVRSDIGVDVVGKGSFSISVGTLEFLKSVGSGQSITAGGGSTHVRVDQPNEFAATVNLGPRAAVDLVGLATADSISYTNDMLNIWSGNEIIDTVHLVDQTLGGFSVLRGGGVVEVFGVANQPGALPFHVGS